MGLFDSKTLNEISKKEDELFELIPNVCKHYGLSDKTISSYVENCHSAIDHFFANNKDRGLNKYRPTKNLLAILIKDFEQIRFMDNRIIAKNLLSFVGDFFFTRVAIFNGTKQMLNEFINEFQEVFTNCINDGIKTKSQTPELRRYEDEIISLRNQLKELDKQSVEYKIDEKHKEEKKKRISESLAQNEKHYANTLLAVNRNASVVESRISNYMEHVNDTIGTIYSESALLKEEIANEQEKAAALKENEQLRNAVFGPSDDLTDISELKQEQEKAAEEIVDSSNLPGESRENIKQLLKEVLEESNIATKSDVQESTKEIKGAIDAQTEELKKSIEEASKLDIQELANRLTDLYQKEPEDSGISNQQDIPIVVAIKEKDIPIKVVVNSMLNAIPPLFVGAAAYLRSLIDSYAKYGFGIEMNPDQHIFKTAGKSAALATIFDSNSEDVKTRNDNLNLYIHNSAAFLTKSDEDKKNELIEAANYLSDTLGIEFSKIDYVDGVKKLYEAELNEINRLGRTFDVHDLHIGNGLKRKPGQSDKSYYPYVIGRLYLYSKNRLAEYKNFLVLSGVDESYFTNLGEPIAQDKIVMPSFS